MKLVTIVGARPQFIKAAPVSRAIQAHNQRASQQSSRITEVLVHTGQHYDDNMSEVFFRELELPRPDYNLGVGSGSHAVQTGEMLKRIEGVLVRESPDYVLVYGDTNSTLAGGLAAAKLQIPVAHIEAGLRSLNRRMPEEINRVLTDHLSTLLFCPTEAAVRNLSTEGITQGVHLVGDVMYDALVFNLQLSQARSHIHKRLGIKDPHSSHTQSYYLVTVHRAENTDDARRLQSIVEGLQKVSAIHPVIWPVHPRTRKKLEMLDLSCLTAHLPPIILGSIHLIEPVSYLDMLALEKHAMVILTDSGGVQKEAYWLGVPCVTLRDETEWMETVTAGWNVLVGCDPDRVMEATTPARPNGNRPSLYGDGRAARRIVQWLPESLPKELQEV